MYFVYSCRRGVNYVKKNRKYQSGKRLTSMPFKDYFDKHRKRLYSSCNEPGYFCLVSGECQIDDNDLSCAGCVLEYEGYNDPLLEQLEAKIKETNFSHYVLWGRGWFSVPNSINWKTGYIMSAVEAAKTFIGS
jgi:hypothetical protein